jgi:hypothetical protein
MLNTKVLYLFVFLAPIFFIPTVFVSLDSTKYLFITVGSLILGIISLLQIFTEKKVTMPHKFVFWTACFMVASLLVSSLASSNPYKSIFGQGFEAQTFVFVLSSLVLMFVVFDFAKTKEKILGIFSSLSLSFVILALFTVLRIIFGAGFLGFGMFNSVLSTPFMSYYSLVIFGSVLLLVSLSMRLFMALPKKMKISLLCLEIVSFVLALLANDTKVYIILLAGLASFIVINLLTKSHSKKIFLTPIIFALIAILSIIFRSSVISPIAHAIKADYGEITLSQSLTNTVLSQSLSNSPILGYGPNRFVEAFIDSKGIEFNKSQFWSLEFSSGFSLISTYIAICIV